jgi:hypothetical protein
MKKNLLLLLIAMGICSTTIAQVSQETAKTLAVTKQNELLSNIKKLVGPEKSKSKVKWGEAKKDNQFLIAETFKMGKRINISPECNKCNISTVHKIIKKKKNFDVKSIDWVPIDNNCKVEPYQKKNDKGKVTEKGYNVVFKVRQFHSVIDGPYYIDKKGDKKTVKSDARYDLTMTWKVADKKKPEAVLMSIKSTPVSNENELKANANKTVNAVISKWYEENVPPYFANKVNGDVLLTPQPESTPKVSVRIANLQKEVTVNDNLPSVRVYVDPSKYMSPDSSYVNNAKAVYTFNPIAFKVRFTDEDYAKAEIVSVEFDDGILARPHTVDANKANTAKAMEMAKQSKDRIVSAFENYTQNPSKENADQFMSLFTKNAKVGVAVITKNGEVKNEPERSVSDYVKRLKGASVKIEQVWEPKNIDVTNDPWSADVDFLQNVVRDSYCDHTKKSMHLVKDANGEFKIEKITVVENPTPCEQ